MLKITFGDVLLKVFRWIIFSVEFRHYCLPYLAWFYRFCDQRSYYQKSRCIEFWDGSLSWSTQSPIFLAAGASKNAKGVFDFFKMGFGGVTVGSVTLIPHSGNSYRPKIALIPQDKSIQNAMGLGNEGLSKILERLKRSFMINKNLKSKGSLPIGLSITEKPGSQIGKDAKNQILKMFIQAYSTVDYFEINLSCPNTETQRIDQYLDFSQDLLKSIAEIRKEKSECKAVFIKLSPDMEEKIFEQFLSWIERYGLTGIVLANTLPLIEPLLIEMKTSFEKIKILNPQGGKGGLSGNVLYENTLRLVKKSKSLKPNLSVIAVGGIDSAVKVKELLNAGASVVQCYTVLAYRWNPIRRILKDLEKL